MPERIVVAFRGVGLAKPAGGLGYIDRAIAMKKRAEVHGATLCGWGAQTFAFELSPEDLEEAIALATSVVEDGSVPPAERFAVGVAHGTVTPIGESGTFATLAWGRPLVVAVLLAGLAKPGEVLVDRELPAVGTGELLWVGSRSGSRPAGRVRGVLLDVAEPWRRQAAHSVARLVEPALVGPLADLDPVVPLGCLGVVRAARGAGGTRALREIAARLDPARVLAVAPAGASLEPLGALRRALARAVAIEGAPALPGRLQATLERVLASDGVDLAEAAELVDAWLAPAGERAGLITIDDAAEVDEPTLEAIADAMNLQGAFRALARLDDAGPLPVPLAGIPAGPPIAIAPIDAADAQAIVTGLLGGAVDPATAARWAKRGGGSPLGLREAVAESLGAGDLAWTGARAAPRRRSAGRGAAGTARHFLDLRLRHLSEDERSLLDALAVLGGDASDLVIDAVVARAESRAARSVRVAPAVLDAGFVTRPEPGWLRLASRSALDALLASLAPGPRASLHRAACETLARAGGPLARADAAWHAAQAGDGPEAARHAVDASRSAMRAGLDGAALALITFARAHDIALAELAYAEVRAVASLRPPPARPGASSMRPSFPDPTTRSALAMPPLPSVRPGPPRPSVPRPSPLQVSRPIATGMAPPPLASAAQAHPFAAPARRPIPPLAPPSPSARPAPSDPGPQSVRGRAIAFDDDETHELPAPSSQAPSARPIAASAPRSLGAPSSPRNALPPSAPSAPRNALPPSAPSAPRNALPPSAPTSTGPNASSRVPAPRPSSTGPSTADASAPLGQSSAPISAVIPSSTGVPGSAPEALADAPGAAGHDPAGLARRLADEARRALVRRDVAALEGLITRMRATGENDELVERMSAMVALGRGAKAEALSKLRQAADAPELLPPHRPRARLAYSVALAAAGRREAALLEALTALARARELGDRHGEHACARFLARLAAAAGHPSAASTWARVARLAAAPTSVDPT